MDETDIIKGINQQDDGSYKKLYELCYPVVEKYILQNSGNSEDARDIFQDTIIILYEKAGKDNLEITSSLNTFIYSISRNLWLKKLRDRREMNIAVSEDFSDSAEEKLISKETTNNLLLRLGRAFGKMTNHCKMLIYSMFFKKKSLDAITRDNGYKNMHSAQNQKYKCLEQARKEFKK